VCASVTTTEDESEYEDERWTCARKRLMELHLKNKIRAKCVMTTKIYSGLGRGRYNNCARSRSEDKSTAASE
jgi:hypothetical protein